MGCAILLFVYRESNQIMLDNILWYLRAAAGLHIYHGIIKPAVAANFVGGFIFNAEFYPAAFIINGFDPGFYDEIIAHG